jgi:hypothetical protein
MIIRGDEPIFILRKTSTGTDQYGNPQKSVEEILIPDCLFWYGSTNEPVDVSRDPVDAQLTVCFPRGTVIHDDDEFEIRDTVWVKDGIAQEYSQLWPGFDPGVLVQVRRRVG